MNSSRRRTPLGLPPMWSRKTTFSDGFYGGSLATQNFESDGYSRAAPASRSATSRHTVFRKTFFTLRRATDLNTEFLQAAFAEVSDGIYEEELIGCVSKFTKIPAAIRRVRA